MSKIKQYKQKFRKAWLKDELLIDWLIAPVKEDARAQCKFCHCELKAKYQDLIAHAKSKKHIRAMSRHILPEISHYNSHEVRKTCTKLEVSRFYCILRNDTNFYLYTKKKNPNQIFLLY